MVGGGFGAPFAENARVQYPSQDVDIEIGVPGIGEEDTERFLAALNSAASEGCGAADSSIADAAADAKARAEGEAVRRESLSFGNPSVPGYPSRALPVANKYEAFIIDIWGVLWDGIEPYQNSIDSLKKLINLNKYIVLLSNAPRRSKVVSKRLEDIGIDSSYYHKIISSGEICRLKFLKNKELLNKFGDTYYFIGQEQDQTITELLKLTETDNIKKADFVLVCGTRRFEDTLNDYIKELDLAFSYNLPLICANPDKVVIRKTGELLVCAGSMAKYYKKKGGLVFQYGKPFIETYKLCFDYLIQKNKNIDKNNILCIGDALETDILGANNFGLESLLIANGIHKNQLNPHNNTLSETHLKKFFETQKVIPKYILKEFIF